MTVKPIPGQPPSEQIRKQLADSGKPVLLAFSRGKDSIATWLALRDAGVERIVPYHFTTTPGLDLESSDLARWEAVFGTEIINVPHPAFYKRLMGMGYQPASRGAVLMAADLPVFSYDELTDLFREDHGLDADTWVCDGVRAADSPVRRTAFADHGVWRSSRRRVSPIYDWDKADVMGRIEAEGLDLPADYGLFGRSLDGVDWRFTEPIKRNRPADWETTRLWWPLIEAELLRRPLVEARQTELRASADQSSYRGRKAAERERFGLASDGEFYVSLDFPSREVRDAFTAWVGVEAFEGVCVNGHDAAQALGISLAEVPKALFSGRKKTNVQRRMETLWLQTLPKVPDPLRSVKYTGDLTVDAAAELDALCAELPDDGHNAVLYFTSSTDKQKFLYSAGLIGFGSKLLPGNRAWQALKKRRAA